MRIKMNKDQTLLKVFPVQTKSYSGFFRYSRNSIPYSLKLTDSNLVLRFLGIPFIKIDIKQIIDFKYAGNEWVGVTFMFKGVVIKYKKNNGHIKERIIGFYSEKIAREFFDILKGIIRK
jgi:hypothetical protein